MATRNVTVDPEFRLTVHITVSGGFAVVQPGSQLSINAVEGFPLSDFSAEVSIEPEKTEAFD